MAPGRRSRKNPLGPHIAFQGERFLEECVFGAPHPSSEKCVFVGGGAKPVSCWSHSVRIRIGSVYIRAMEDISS